MTKTNRTFPLALWSCGLLVLAASGAGALFAVWFLGGLAVLSALDG